MTADRCNDAKRRKMGADCIDDRRLLANEQMPRAMEYQATLLLWRLGWHKPHIGSGHRFADRLGISGIVLLSLDVGLHVSRWHQPHGVTCCLELARPVMRGSTGLNAYQTGRQFLKERQNVTALQLTTDDHLAGGINAVHLKDRFGDIETDCRDRVHG